MRRTNIEPGKLIATVKEGPQTDIFGYHRSVHGSQDLYLTHFDYRSTQGDLDMAPSISLSVVLFPVNPDIPGNLESILKDVLEHAITYYQADKSIDLDTHKDRVGSIGGLRS